MQLHIRNGALMNTVASLFCYYVCSTVLSIKNDTWANWTDSVFFGGNPMIILLSDEHYYHMHSSQVHKMNA
jgi:hypothetical protein